MMLSTYTCSYWKSLAFLLFVSGLLVACQGKPSAEDYAQRLCDCYGAEFEGAKQLREGAIDRVAYDALVVDCMGEDDPIKKLEDDPQAALEFKAAFLDAVQTICPDVARNLGY